MKTKRQLHSDELVFVTPNWLESLNPTLPCLVRLPRIETCPTEIWHEIFAYACTDAGLTGRSLSLVSKRFYDISGPLKYQSIAITRWRQLIAFSQTFPQLPELQKKIKYLFIHCPYPFLDVEDDPRLADPSAEEEDWDFEDSELYPSTSESDSDLDSEFDGSLDSDEEQEVLEDVEYIQTLGKGSLPPEENSRDGQSEALDYKIQEVFDKATHALHAILKETSSTLKILTLYWTSFTRFQIHTILSGLALPFLDELHLYRCYIVGPVQVDLPTTTLLPRLRLLAVSDDWKSEPLERDISIIAPNLTHLRLPPTKFDHVWRWSSKQEDVILKVSNKRAFDQLKAFVRKRRFDESVITFPVKQNIGILPEHWQMLWSSRVAGLPDFWSVHQDSLWT